MSTGACGINCDVCQLNLLGLCSTCGPGKSIEAERKLAAQKASFGRACAILECARLNNINYCLRDCGSFPCDNFATGNYPYGQGYLDMQARRRNSGPPPVDPSGRPIHVADELWDNLEKKDLIQLSNYTLADIDSVSGMLVFNVLGKQTLVDVKSRCLRIKDGSGWEKADNPLLELATVVYLTSATAMMPMGNKLVTVRDLKDAHYFEGPATLKTDVILKRYGDDIQGFKSSLEYLDGEPVDMADCAYKLLPFPRIPIYYLLWKADTEFDPRVSVLFDSSIETILTPPAIWSLVNLTSFALLRGPVNKM